MCDNENIIIKDDYKSEAKKFIVPILCVLAIAFYNLISDIQSNEFSIISILLVVFVAIVSAYYEAYLFTYCLRITLSQIHVKALWRKKTVELKEITSYKFKKYGVGEIYNFIFIYRNKRMVVSTRYKDDFIRVLTDANIVCTNGESAVKNISRRQKERLKLLGDIFFGCTIATIPVAFAIASKLGEPEIFSVFGIMRYIWIMLLFIPIGIASVVVGVQLKRYNQPYKKNYIVALICIPLLLLFGSIRFISSDTISYDEEYLQAISQSIGYDLPQDIKIATEKQDNGYVVSYVKIVNTDERNEFQAGIDLSEYWQTELNSEIYKHLPMEIQFEMDAFDYFMLYNKTKNEYNQNSILSREYKYTFLAYDAEESRLIIVDKLIIA